MPDSNINTRRPRVALIGFGEAGLTFAACGKWCGHAAGYDLLAPRRDLMAQNNVQACDDAASCLAGADIVLSLVTADAALDAARDYAPLLDAGCIWGDMNSVSPATKQAAARSVEAAGAHYVDAAVMAPVEAGLAVPLLLAGNRAGQAAEMLAALGFATIRVVGAEAGQASAIKMIRSIMVKGTEALTYECAAAAEQAGVFDEVMASLDASEKNWGWAQKTAYNRERMATHGNRRAAEMEEVCNTLRDLGIEPVMSAATVLRQRNAALPNQNQNKNEKQRNTA